MDIKPGYTTTEFWISLLTPIVGIFAMQGVIGQDQAMQIVKAISDIIVILVPLVVYVYNRTYLKKTVIDKAARQ